MDIDGVSKSVHKLTLAKTTIELNMLMLMPQLPTNDGDNAVIDVNDGVGDVNGAVASL